MMRVMVRNWITLYNRSLDVCVQTCGAQTLFSNLKWTMKWCSFAVLIEHTSTQMIQNQKSIRVLHKMTPFQLFFPVVSGTAVQVSGSVIVVSKASYWIKKRQEERMQPNKVSHPRLEDEGNPRDWL